MFMGKITSFLSSLKISRDLNRTALSLLSASAVLRKEKELREILTYLKEHKFSRRKIYEALLQTYLFAGYPSALISLQTASEYFKADQALTENPDMEQFIDKRREKLQKNIWR